MDALLMLGIIPGTNIQINFNSWLACMGIVLCLSAISAVHRSRVVPMLRMARAIRHADPTAVLAARLA